MIDVEIEDKAWNALPNAEVIVRQAAASVLTFILSPPANEGGESGLTILLTDDETVRDLNLRFRHKDAPTNVLSFPAPPTAAPHLGDIVLAYSVCATEAAEQGKPLAAHLTHLVAHGVLHLLGYDHETDPEAEVMEAMERDILARLGVADPYASDRLALDDPDVPL